MKVAVTARENELTSKVDERFGRAHWLVVIDTDTGKFSAHDNQVNLNAVQGAGIQTSQNIANLGVEAVITSNVGPNAFKTLDAAGIKIYQAGDTTVEQAIEDFKAGKLQQVSQANVGGHW